MAKGVAQTRQINILIKWQRGSQATYNSTFLKNLSRNIEGKVIWIHHTFHKAQVSWKLQDAR